MLRDEFLCVEENIKLIFRLHGQVYDHSVSPRAEDNGWAALMRVKEKRNQITHPKSVADLEVSAEQAREALMVYLWIRGYLDRIEELENSKMKAIYEDFLKSD